MNEFESPHRRLKQAIRKSHQFHIEMTEYLKAQFHSRVIEVHPETGCKLHKVKVVRFPADDLTDLAYEAIDAYRSALDHTAYACAVLSGLSGKALERVYFPVSRDPAQFENSIATACQGLHPDIVDLFRSFKAFPGGNDALSELNLIRRQGHHRLIVPVGTAGSVRPGLGSMSRTRPEYIPGPIWDQKNHELVFRADCPSGSFGYDAHVSFDIVFGEVDAVAGKPVWPFLLNAAEAVDRVVRDAEAKAEEIWSKPRRSNG